ncbi:hypothetical protein KEM56_005160 [Ascosphaera pollenicola]|nr:hypothetical protein KEM56_005160 [Ascosphaera pollenicola]
MAFMTTYTNLTTEQELLQRRLASVDADMAKVARRAGGAITTTSTSTAAATPAAANGANGGDAPGGKQQWPSFVATAKASQIRAREKLERVNRDVEAAEREREVLLGKLTAVFVGALKGASASPGIMAPPAVGGSGGGSGSGLGAKKKEEKEKEATESAASAKMEREFARYRSTMEERMAKLEASLAAKQAAIDAVQDREAKRENKIDDIDKDLSVLWDKRYQWKEHLDDMKDDVKREFVKVQNRVLEIEKKNVTLLERAETSEDHWRAIEKEQREGYEGVRKKVMQSVKDLDAKISKVQAEKTTSSAQTTTT